MRTRLAIVVVLALTLSVTSAALFPPKEGAPTLGGYLFGNPKGVGVGGGTDCALCTGVTGLLEQVAVINYMRFEDLLEEVCSFFPDSAIQDACDFFVTTFGKDIVDLVEQDASGDEVCRALGVCTLDTCNLWAPGNGSATLTRKSQHASSAANVIEPQFKSSILVLDDADKGKEDIAEETPWELLQKLILEIGTLHEPPFDPDNDLYATEQTLRGTSWRGKDCHEFTSDIYPGRSNSTHPPSIDHNCNGILGTADNGSVYEDLYCSGQNNMGIVVVGDSAGAHFEIPPSYVTAADINDTTYKKTPDIWFRLENEFDIPEKSYGTGYEANSTNEPVDSFYLRMYNRNKCIHRDYQNLGVNGARSGAVANGNYSLDKDIARNQDTDYPVLMIFELVGNDVCNGHPDYWNTMTTVPEFRENILTALQYYDTVLPKGSHIMFVGLADGRVLYDNLHNRTHPLGITYADFYTYLNCLQISPCYVWMNTNETIRNAGSWRAGNLSLVYNEIIANYTFENFDMAYYPFPFEQMAALWTSRGGEVWQLIEPVDGFHPNQIANSLQAEIMFEQLVADHPDWFGDPNPYNDQITMMFGDQGGY